MGSFDTTKQNARGLLRNRYRGSFLLSRKPRVLDDPLNRSESTFTRVTIVNALNSVRSSA